MYLMSTTLSSGYTTNDFECLHHTYASSATALMTCFAVPSSFTGYHHNCICEAQWWFTVHLPAVQLPKACVEYWRRSQNLLWSSPGRHRREPNVTESKCKWVSWFSQASSVLLCKPLRNQIPKSRFNKVKDETLAPHHNYSTGTLADKFWAAFVTVTWVVKWVWNCVAKIGVGSCCIASVGGDKLLESG